MQEQIKQNSSLKIASSQWLPLTLQEHARFAPMIAACTKGLLVILQEADEHSQKVRSSTTQRAA